MWGIIKVLLIIAAIIAAIFILIFLRRMKKNGKQLVKTFQRGNVIVTGHKGHGKDLLFSYIINKREDLDETAYSNTKYSELTEPITVKDLSVEPNTYREFLEGNTEQIGKVLKEEQDIYIADAGLYLPSTYQDKLVKLYPSMPLFYAIQRHLYNSNTHVNVQNLERLWDKLREQADYYIECLSCIRLPFTKIFIQKMIYYDRYQAAKERVRPFKVDMRLLGKDKQQQALKRDFESKYGEVKYLYIWNPLPEESYDTRQFHFTLFGEPAPRAAKRTRRERKKKNEETDGENIFKPQRPKKRRKKDDAIL